MVALATRRGILAGLVTATLFLLWAAESEMACASDDVNPVALLRGVENSRLQLPPSKLVMPIEFRLMPHFRTQYVLKVNFSENKRRFKQESDAATQFSSIFDGKQAMIFDGDSATIRDMAQATPDYLFDPRTLGITTTYVWEDSVQSSLGYHNAKSVSLIGSEVLDKKLTWHISVVDTYGQKKDYWIAPQAGFPVLRHEFLMEPQHNITISEYAVIPGSPMSTVLPKRIRTEYFVNDRPSGVRMITVERLERDASADARTWTLAGLNLPVRTPVSDIRIHKRIGYWDGQGLRKEPMGKAPGKGADRPEPSRGSGSGYLVVANLILVAIVVTAVFFRGFRRRDV